MIVPVQHSERTPAIVPVLKDHRVVTICGNCNQAKREQSNHNGGLFSTMD